MCLCRQEIVFSGSFRRCSSRRGSRCGRWRRRPGTIGIRGIGKRSAIRPSRSRPCRASCAIRRCRASFAIRPSRRSATEPRDLWADHPRGALDMGLYLVTGGAGFIGSSIARALIARGDGVRILDNFSTGKHENIADIVDRVELLEGDIRDDRDAGAGDRRRRGGVPRGGDRVGARVDGGAAGEPRRQRDRNDARPRGRAPRRRAPGRLRRVVGGLRRRARPAQGRDDAAGADLAVRRHASWRARSRCRCTRAPSAWRRSASATSTCSARGRIRSRNTRP